MIDLVKKARSLATRLHAFQIYGDGLPYDYHLEAVVDVLKFFGFKDENIIASAWLHDVLEDTSINYAYLVREFNKEIADMVYAVTGELGKNRKERHQKTYPKIKGNSLATVLKLADRIANVKYSYFSSSTHDKFNMYRAEHKEFEEGVRHIDPSIKTNCTKMWEYLEDIFKRGIPE
jgi:guanosine-3',5'-bis(diphosphate) 3'-pyrophosphohydrolase